MSGKAGNANIDLSVDYREESIKLPAAMAVVAMLLVGIPLATWIYRIDAAGKKLADVSKYEVLVEGVNGDVQTVNAVLSNDARLLEGINRDEAKKVTLIVPEVVIVENRKDQPKEQSPLKADLDGIYWNPANPLVTIDGETYRIGDIVQGYEIIEINKRSVRFKGQDGTVVEKDIYEGLLQNQK